MQGRVLCIVVLSKMARRFIAHAPHPELCRVTVVLGGSRVTEMRERSEDFRRSKPAVSFLFFSTGFLHGFLAEPISLSPVRRNLIAISYLPVFGLLARSYLNKSTQY